MYALKFAPYLYAVILFVHFTTQLAYIDLFLNPQQKLKFNAIRTSEQLQRTYNFKLYYERSNDNKENHSLGIIPR